MGASQTAERASAQQKSSEKAKDIRESESSRAETSIPMKQQVLEGKARDPATT